MPKTQDRKTTKKNVSVSINEKLLSHFDEMLEKLKITRTDAVEQAILLWLEKEIEKEDADYYAESADQLNADAKDWNAKTTESARRSW